MKNAKDKALREAAAKAAEQEIHDRSPETERSVPGTDGVGQRAGGGATLPGTDAGGAEPRLGFVADEEETPTGPLNAADYVEAKEPGKAPADANRQEDGRERE